jgi:putative isomerase
MAGIQFDLRFVPFSRYGSYLAFSHLTSAEPPGLYLRTVHDNASSQEVFYIELLDQTVSVPFKEIATPVSLRLEADAGYVEFCFAEPHVLRVRGEGVGMRLTLDTRGGYCNRGERFDHAFSPDGIRWEVNSFSRKLKFELIPLHGTLTVDAPWSTIRCEKVIADFLPDSNRFECAIEAFEAGWLPRSFLESFDTCRSQVEKEFERWREKMPSAPAAYKDTSALAAYVNWASVVAPAGHITRPVMLMSKNWMSRIWSWDHCFNALALVEKDPQFAWDQLMVFVDNQHPQGVFPDSLGHTTQVWSFCKPPIHGWILKLMMERTSWIDTTRLQEIYAPLCRWTEWWFNYRDADQDGIPQYNHGNDSGWDNATVFDQGMPVESPDLAAFLVIQMDTLAEVAARIGSQTDSQQWKDKAGELLKRLIAHSWNGEQFISQQVISHKVCGTDSLINFLPLLLGQRLPMELQTKLVGGINRFITDHGFATENPTSDQYDADGYWRGPIWAPTTMMLVYGLNSIGRRDLAMDISHKFCEMVRHSGMAENFDALTGVGLRDGAYTWTSSVFAILAHEFLLGGTIGS